MYSLRFLKDLYLCSTTMCLLAYVYVITFFSFVHVSCICEMLCPVCGSCEITIIQLIIKITKVMRGNFRLHNFYPWPINYYGAQIKEDKIGLII
jgi:hypothetical protein